MDVYFFFFSSVSPKKTREWSSTRSFWHCWRHKLSVYFLWLASENTQHSTKPGDLRDIYSWNFPLSWGFSRGLPKSMLKSHSKMTGKGVNWIVDEKGGGLLTSFLMTPFSGLGKGRLGKNILLQNTVLDVFKKGQTYILIERSPALFHSTVQLSYHVILCLERKEVLRNMDVCVKIDSFTNFLYPVSCTWFFKSRILNLCKRKWDKRQK